jgi:hypothetical protein
MKNVLRLLILAAAVASFTLPALAQDTPAAGAPSVCTSEADAKAALYKKFLDNYKGTPEQQKVAYETAKEYVGKYGTCPDEGDKKIAAFLQKRIALYEEAVGDFEFTESFNKKDYARTFELGRARLNKQPDNINDILFLTRAGYANIGPGGPNNKSLNPEAARMTRRAIELIESGKAPDKWEPFPNRDEALGFLYYTLGLITQETSPADASAAFIKVAQSNSTFKREPSTFTYLANIYEVGELKKLVDEYGVAFPPNVPIPDEKKPQYDQMLAQIGKVQDRIIDAYARAAALMGSDPKYAANKKAVMNKLTAYYKQRHEGSPDTEIQELVNNILSKPIPIPGQEPATPAAPATSSGTNGANAAGTAPVGQPVANPAAPAAGTTQKPAATTTTPPASTPPKPKPISKKTAPAAKSGARKTTSGR